MPPVSQAQKRGNKARGKGDAPGNNSQYNLTAEAQSQGKLQAASAAGEGMHLAMRRAGKAGAGAAQAGRAELPQGDVESRGAGRKGSSGSVQHHSYTTDPQGHLLESPSPNGQGYNGPGGSRGQGYDSPGGSGSSGDEGGSRGAGAGGRKAKHQRKLGSPREVEHPTPWEERGSMALLVLLYMMQGIPMGLTLGAL